MDLFAWRLLRLPAYAPAMFALGAPVWTLPAPGTSQDAAGTSLWDYSVKLGVRHLTSPAVEERAQRFRLFVEEAGGSLPPAVPTSSAMCTALSALWRLPLSNDLKQAFWLCFLDGLPTAARRHQPRERCNCGSGPYCPGRRHHFGECPVAQAVIAAVTQCIPPRPAGNVLAELRAVTPPPGVLPGVWAIVTLAAHAAMEAGRRRLFYLVHKRRARRGAVLAAEVSAFAVHHLRATLSEACRAKLPSAWRQAAPVGHPFMGWDTAAGCWLLSMPTH